MDTIEMMKNSHPQLRRSAIILAVISLTIVFAALNAPGAAASQHSAGATPTATATLTTAPTETPVPTITETPGPTPVPSATPLVGNPHVSGDCLACHGNPNMKGKTQTGEVISLYVTPVVDQSSYHTQKNVGCGFCHLDQATYPHKRASQTSCRLCHADVTGGAVLDPKADMVFDLPFADSREIALSVNQNCQNCHGDKFEAVKDSAHTRIFNEGNRFAPVCVDCHSAHTIGPVTRIGATQICSKCHAAEYSAYRTSVHGAALNDEFNHDVPNCEDCHGSHKVNGPAEESFRANVATQLCGKCHADKALMAKYGLSTEILSTYLDDVHGRTDLMGNPDNTAPVKATCYDCHGTHNILSPKNPYSKVYPDNLQKTCQQCHKDASITFPQTWLSHKTPSESSMPGLFFTNQFSLNAVIAVIAAIVLFIIFDLRQRRIVKMFSNTRRED